MFRMSDLENLKKQFGKRVAQLRLARSLRQIDLAEITGFSEDSIGAIERGIQGVSFERLPVLADALGVQVWQLFVFSE
jgi:transcriptional regulator with XRE-family HTH domain